MTNNRSDRIAGVVLLVVAIWYIIESTTLKVPTAVADNLGPGAFPLILGIILAICSIFLIIRPDPDPAWPGPMAWVKMGLIIVSFIVYAYIMEPLGFIVTTTLEMIALGYIFKGPLLWTPVIGLVFTLALYALFSFVLGLSLPTGELIELYLLP